MYRLKVQQICSYYVLCHRIVSLALAKRIWDCLPYSSKYKLLLWVFSIISLCLPILCYDLFDLWQWGSCNSLDLRYRYWACRDPPFHILLESFRGINAKRFYLLLYSIALRTSFILNPSIYSSTHLKHCLNRLFTSSILICKVWCLYVFCLVLKLNIESQK